MTRTKSFLDIILIGPNPPTREGRLGLIVDVHVVDVGDDVLDGEDLVTGVRPTVVGTLV